MKSCREEKDLGALVDSQLNREVVKSPPGVVQEKDRCDIEEHSLMGMVVIGQQLE